MSAPLSDERLTEVRDLLASITSGEWEMYRYPRGGGRIFVEGIGDHYTGRALIADMQPDPEPGATVYHQGDRDFLFAAPGIVADLLAEVVRLRAICDKCGHLKSDHSVMTVGSVSFTDCGAHDNDRQCFCTASKPQ